MNIGLVSAATYRHGDQPVRNGSHHGTAFAATFNGFDEEIVKQHEWTFVRAKKRIEGHKVVKVWDQDKEWAQRLAEACSIPEVCDTAEQCTADVDLAIIVDDGSAEQWRYAEHPLNNGTPTFCDKPLAMTAKRARAMADLAEKTGTPFMSASSLRFVPDILKLRDEVESVGPVNLAQAICGNELIYYGIHALSMIYAVLGDGGGAVSVHNVGQPWLERGAHSLRGSSRCRAAGRRAGLDARRLSNQPLRKERLEDCDAKPRESLHLPARGVSQLRQDR